jgi:hypothetical protein
MTAQAGPVDGARRRWRLLCLAVALLGLVVVLSSALPWFSETRMFTNPDSSRTEAINLWTEGPSVSARGRAGGLGQLAATGQWGLFVVITAALGMLCGLFARGRHPGDPQLAAALRLNAGAAVLGPIFAVLALVGANSGERVSAVPHVGFLLAAPALLAWLVCAVLMWRTASAAKRAGRRTW